MLIIIIMVIIIIIITIIIIIIIIIITIITITIMIGKIMSHDCHRGKGNLSLACVDVKKAYDHKWLNEIMELHRFPS